VNEKEIEREIKIEKCIMDSGWQLQKKPATVHLMLEDALVRVTKQPREQILLVGASRTDAGVHALGQAST
jgi:tRNA pseudouridine(38-40) synthase